VLWERGGWSGVVTLLGVFLGAALAIALRLRRLAPLAPVLAAA
jgi:YNFM family putative membrane transporter